MLSDTLVSSRRAIDSLAYRESATCAHAHTVFVIRSAQNTIKGGGVTHQDLDIRVVVRMQAHIPVRLVQDKAVQAVGERLSNAGS